MKKLLIIATLAAAPLFAQVEGVLSKSVFVNGEVFTVHKVRIHETVTGYAECFKEDIDGSFMPKVNLKAITYSPKLIEQYNLGFEYESKFGDKI